MLAYTWPLLSLFWTFLIFAGISLLLFFVIFCFVDNFRRRDHQGLAKAGWTLLILLVPFVGALIYIVARPADARTGSLRGVSPGSFVARCPALCTGIARARTGEFRVSLDADVGYLSVFQGKVQESAMQNHHPKVTQRPDRAWVVECAQCRNDRPPRSDRHRHAVAGQGDGRAAAGQPRGSIPTGRRL